MRSKILLTGKQDITEPQTPTEPKQNEPKEHPPLPSFNPDEYQRMETEGREAIEEVTIPEITCSQSGYESTKTAGEEQLWQLNL